jgi:amphi-Trp domain-containing protein
MSDFRYEEAERLSPQQTAERLIDIAYALTAGGPIELNATGRRIAVPIAGEVLLERELTAKDGQVELELALRWSAPAE